MSTILDALRKLQRERAAQSTAKDLRGSITHESAARRARRRSGGSSLAAILLVLLTLGGGGYLVYKSGQVQGLLARFQSDAEPAPEGDLAALGREGAPAQTLQPNPAEQAATTPAARPPRRPRSARALPPAGAVPAPAESPEILAERARLEAALANARAAEEAQQRAELDAVTQQLDPNPTPPEPASAAASAATPEPVPTPTPKLVVAKRKPPTKAKPAEPVVAASPAQPTQQPKPQPKSEPKPEAPDARPTREVAAEPAPSPSAFPEVRVASIRWHPVAERRVASLQFERQNAPEAHEGDIVAGVLVYRIDPGSVELRVGGAQRTVSPGP